jgi:hypothetical protein
MKTIWYLVGIQSNDSWKRQVRCPQAEYRPTYAQEPLTHLLSSDANWLIIFDNADSDDKEDLLNEFMPVNPSGSVLVTSRDSALARNIGGEVLDGMSKGDAVELLLRLTSRGERHDPVVDDYDDAQILEARQIVQNVNCLAIGVLQAARVINADAMTLSDFLEEFDRRDLITRTSSLRLVRRPDDPYPLTLSTVWKMSFEKLRSDQRTLLNVLSFLDPDMIQVDLLRPSLIKAASARPHRLFVLDTISKFNKCKGAVIRSSLVNQSPNTNHLWMHRLVQDACQLNMSTSERQEAFMVAYECVKSMWPVAERDNRHRPDLWPLQMKCFPHVESIARNFHESHTTDTPLSADSGLLMLVCDAAFYTYERGVPEPCIPLCLIAEAHACRYDDSELIMVDMYRAKGSVETETNQFQACYDSFVREFEYWERAVSKNLVQLPDIRAVFACGGIANGCHALNRYEEAERWYRKTFEVWDGLPGDRKIYVSPGYRPMCDTNRD